MENQRQCLIITATIHPNSNYVTQTDAGARRLEYLEVLRYYINNFDGDIFFIENSDYNVIDDKDFTELFALPNVQLISFPKSIEVEKGKGYQEFEVLDFVVSQLGGKYDEFIKVSGRYLTVNFNKLIKQKNNGIIIDRHKKKKIAITSFFRCKVDFYLKNLKNCYQEVDDNQGIFIEHVVYIKLKSLDRKNIDLFDTTPVYKGISGSYGGSLNRHPVKIKMINIERFFLSVMKVNELHLEY